MPTETDDLQLPSREDLMVDPSKLPTPPAVVLEVIHHLGDEDNVSMPKLATIIGREPSLAASVLKIANSALYSPATRVTSLPQALMTIGLRQLRVHVMATSMRQILPADSEGGLNADEIRKRTVINGALSRIFAQKVFPNLAEEAFLGGLLGSIGHLVMAQEAPIVYEHLTTIGGGWPDPVDEMELLGFSLDDVAADLLRVWRLPDSLADAVLLRSPLRQGWEDDDADLDLINSLRLGLLSERVLSHAEATEPLRALLDYARPVFGFDLMAVSNTLVEAEPVVAEIASSLSFRDPTDGYAERISTASAEIEEPAAPEGDDAASGDEAG